LAPSANTDGNEMRSDDLFQYAPAATPVASGRRDTSWAGLATTVVPIAFGLMLGVAYLGYAHVQRRIKAQHAELQSLKDTQYAELRSLKDKIQGMAQNRTDVEQSQFDKRNSGTSKPRRYSSWAAKTAAPKKAKTIRPAVQAFGRAVLQDKGSANVFD